MYARVAVNCTSMEKRQPHRVHALSFVSGRMQCSAAAPSRLHGRLAGMCVGSLLVNSELYGGFLLALSVRRVAASPTSVRSSCVLPPASCALNERAA